MIQQAYKPLKVLWDYMHLDMQPQKADCIVGFGNYNDQIALRAAELYRQGYSARVLFTGGLGRNTEQLWHKSEAEHFAETALRAGVPQAALILETRSANTAENILFTRRRLAELGIPVSRILGVHQPFMERRIHAALQVHWPGVEAVITSPQVSIEEYLAHSVRQGVTEKAAIDVIVGDFQRIDVYAKLGYQAPQAIPEAAWQAFEEMVRLGYDGQLVFNAARMGGGPDRAEYCTDKKEQ